MGFDKPNKTLQISKNGEESLEIHGSSDQEKEDVVHTVSVEYLFDTILLKKPATFEIDIAKITVLRLSGCKLRGLPICCGTLNLKQLDLSQNELIEVPVCLYSGLKYLEILDLSHNAINTFDLEPECLLHIKKIKLNNNNLVSLPKWVLSFKCTNLESLNYSTNKAQHYTYLKNGYNLNIMRLRKLKLKNSHLIDSDFAFLKCFNQLQYLDISNKHKKSINKFYEIDELFVNPKWRQLQVLRMNHLSMALFPVGIILLASLRELQVNSNCISWLPEGVECLANLVVLDISNNFIIEIPQNFTKLKNLEVLKASNNLISRVPDFVLMPDLKVLDLYDNKVEEISYNHEFVNGIDLEYNYLDTDNLQDLEYVEKRDIMRLQTGSSSWRTIGPKLLSCSNLSLESAGDSHKSAYSDYSEGECDAISASEEKVIYQTHAVDEEDWDAPTGEIIRNPQIDVADEHWTGIEGKYAEIKENVTESLYRTDEDSMFVDVEDDVE